MVGRAESVLFHRQSGIYVVRNAQENSKTERGIEFCRPRKKISGMLSYTGSWWGIKCKTCGALGPLACLSPESVKVHTT